MNRKEKQQLRADRYRELAVKSMEESECVYNSARQMGDGIPLGEPIHNEADRRYREKISLKMDKCVKLQMKAAYYEQKAKAVESNKAIYLGDDDAVERLESKLAKLEKDQEDMKTLNKIVRSKRLSEEEKIAELCKRWGFKEESAKKCLQPDGFGIVGFPAYQLTNNNASIKRVREQLVKAKSMKVANSQEYELDDVKIVVNTPENRLQLFFYDIPDKDIRTDLKSHGFRWSRLNECWQSYINRSSIDYVKETFGDFMSA